MDEENKKLIELLIKVTHTADNDMHFIVDEINEYLFKKGVLK